MKTLVTQIAAMCFTLALAACASAPSVRAPTYSSALATHTGPVACVGGDTGTRIPAKPGECTGFGTTYSRDDIQGTGQTTIANALRLLDPSVQIHNH